MTPLTTSIAVMARAPAVGHCKTRLAVGVGHVRATAIYRAMLLDTLDALEESGARLVVAAAPENDGVAVLRALAPAHWEILEQRGAGLGERLANVVSDLGDAGASTVAVVDSDSPLAPWPVANRALRVLRGPKRALLGACDDGGYWFFATTAIERRLFEEIAWSTPRVAAETRARCAELGLVVEELPTTFDVDDAADLERLRVELRASPKRAPRTARELAAAS